MKLCKLIILVFFAFSISNINAQLKIDAELRPRFEYRHGFKTLFPNNSSGTQSAEKSFGTDGPIPSPSDSRLRYKPAA